MAISEQNNIVQEFFLTNKFGDRYLFSLNHNTLNLAGAAHLHQNRLHQILTQKNSLCIIIGSDSGTLLPFLAAAQNASGSQFLILEPPDVFARIQNEYAHITLPAHVHFGSADNLSEISDLLDISRYFYAGEVLILKSIAAEYGFLDEYHELFFSVQNYCNHQHWAISAKLQGAAFIHAQLDNLADNVISSSCLHGIFAGKTAVLLAGGPSLDDMLPWVIARRHTLLVLAVSRISRRLLEVGLVPDFVFSIDPHRVSFDVSVEMLRFWQQSIFIHSFHVSPLLLGQWRGKSIFLGCRFPWQTSLNEPSLPMPGPTVANVALSVATEMGFDRIILAGLDLCRSRDGYTHATGSNERAAGPQLAATCVQVETNGGWMAETTSDFFTAIGTISAQAQLARQKNCILINPAEGAARIEGIEHVRLQDITVKETTPLSCTLLLDSLPQSSAAARRKDLELVYQELVRAKGQLLRMKKLTREALNCNEGLFGRQGKRQDFKYKIRMDKIEKTLNTRYAPFSTFVKNYAAHDLLKMTKLGVADREWSDQEIEEAAQIYYANYDKAIHQLIRVIDKAKEKITRRKEEDAVSPDLQHLAAGWERDEIPGRALVWLDRHNMAEADIPPEHQDAFAQVLHANEAQFATTLVSAHMQRSIAFASLQGLRSKLQSYFKKQDKNALHNIQSSLEKSTHPEAKKHYLLCSGLIAELEGNVDRALEQYQLLFEVEDEVFLEDALLRITSISLARGDYDNSLLALETLSKISYTYGTQYADLLRLTGQGKKSLDVYLDYLEQIPGDTTTMLKTGKLFGDMKVIEGARAMFQHVLMLDPDNRAARHHLEELEHSLQP